ncbi:hypothetical protein ESCO_003574 [Escovopsis weberi]|uniref:Uncharacterized protein n=1 Tax=Escovopsis weberi TaxID=150374 RepID=A0A0M8N848_ESCWE|nr:hypothetical protein ESCO_003574 [Escovopsis weberi]
MVTFALPGDYDAASETSGTPKARPPLPFAKRGYVPTPYATKRFASTVNDSPSVTPFTPSLPQGTLKKVFAPGVTPEPSRVYREATAKATPRGVAVHAPEKELFSLRIASPPPELTGEVLADKVPKDWNSNGSIYADQFLSHLCPPDLDEEQRRQFFCILDLRRLKYAANEIFSKKSWKLNIINFAKEFEKSRSIILLRYGLYEFQNVKPSKEVLKRWRREHGLPEPLEDEAEDADADADATPTKPATLKKRKADDNLGKNATEESFPAISAKRRAMARDEAKEPSAATPVPIKNKRKASMTEESPSKLQKATPSSAKSLFEKIANKPSPAPSSTPVSKPPSKLFEGAAAAKSSLFGTEPAETPLTSSVFGSVSKASPSPTPATPSPNIFGYLSDGGSAKNGSVEVDADADAESETDSEPEQSESQETAVSVEHSGATNGAGESDSQSSLFNIKPTATGLETGTSSGTGTRESTPGRSLFDRVTKNKDGQPYQPNQVRSDGNCLHQLTLWSWRIDFQFSFRREDFD